VLFVSFPFPPNASVGTRRIVKFCELLPEQGWEPVVLTVASGDFYMQDHDLAARIAPQVAIFRAPKLGRRPRPKPAPAGGPAAPEPGVQRRDQLAWIRALGRQLKLPLAFPDRHSGWILPALWQGRQILRDHRIDVVLSTSPPSSDHIVGYGLSRLGGLPLVLDFRDLWTGNEGYALRGLPWWFRTTDRRVERQVVAAADQVVTAAPGFSERLRQLLPPERAERVTTITNGIDPAEFAGLPLPDERTERFTLLHLGSLYGLRDPSPFLETLERWLARNPDRCHRVLVRLVGDTRGRPRRTDLPHAESVIREEPPVPRREALARVWQADALLLLLGFSPELRDVIPAKVYEYIYSDRPVLAYLPEGAAAEILRRHTRGLVLTAPDAAAGCAWLDRAFAAWEAREGPAPVAPGAPLEFHRRELTRRLASVLDAAVAEHTIAR
jgi:hypothetical protein